MEKSSLRLESLLLVWHEDDFNLFQKHFINLMLLSHKLELGSYQKLLDKFFDIKGNFDRDTKNFIREDVHDVLKAYYEARNDKGDGFYKAVRKLKIQMYVQRFVYNLRRAVEQRKNVIDKNVGSVSMIDRSLVSNLGGGAQGKRYLYLYLINLVLELVEIIFINNYSQLSMPVNYPC